MAIKGFEKKDPMAGLNQLMQLMNQMNQVQDRQKESVSTSLSSILEASKYATNENTMNNVINQYESMASDSSQFQETNTQYNLIGNILKDRNAQINQYTRSVNDAEKIINGADFLDKESEFVDLHANVMSMKDDNGNQKYESVMEWVSQEYARIESIGMNLVEGKKLGLKRGKGIDDSNITSKIGAYQKRLNVALEALIGDNTITPEEANLIIMGDRDTFKQARNTKVNESKSGIKMYDSLIQGLEKNNSKDEITNLLFNSGLNEADINDTINKAEGDGYFSADLDEAKMLKDNYILERNRLIDTYKSWSGTDYIGQFKTSEQIGAEAFGDAADNMEEGEGFTEADTSLADPSMRTGITVEESKDIEKDKKEIETRKEIRKETPSKIKGTSVLQANRISDRAKKFEIHPSLQKEVDKKEPDGFGYTFGGNQWMFHGEIMTESNILKEKDKILDGSDKASPAMNQFLEGKLNMNQAMTKGKYSDSDRTEIVGQQSRKKLKAFQDKFNNSKKTNATLTIEEFISQNKEEYYEMTKILKYGDYWFKKAKQGISKHYINLYD